MCSSKEKPTKEELISDSIYFLANEIRFLGFGGADRSPTGIGALEGLAMKTYDSNKEIAGAVGDIADSIRESNSEIARALGDVAESIQALAQAISDKEK